MESQLIKKTLIIGTLCSLAVATGCINSTHKESNQPEDYAPQDRQKKIEEPEKYLFNDANMMKDYLSMPSWRKLPL